MADDVQTVPGGHGKKIEYAKDNMERMPYEYYVEKFKMSDPVSISTRLGIVYNLLEIYMPDSFKADVSQE